MAIPENRRRRAAQQDAARYQEGVHDDSWNGVIAGVIAGALLAIGFFFYDLLRFEPLATPTSVADLLAAAGPRTTALMERSLVLGRILGFSLVHLLVFGALGYGAAWLFRLLGWRKSIWLGAMYGLVVCSLVFEAGLRLSGTTLTAVPRWPTILIGNAIAGAAIVGYLRFKEATS